MVNVLIAEDDFRVASVHEKFLENIKGISIAGKTVNALDTLKFLKSHPVDLLILDIYLPDDLGTDLLSKIRERFSCVDVIIVTASTDKNFLLRALQYGVFNYLIKPVSLEKFTEVIENYQNKRSLIEKHDELNQTMIDHYFGHQTSSIETQTIVPKGIDQITLEKVAAIVIKHTQGISAEEAGKEIGVSRTTARRYLEYLISIGNCYAELVYGIVGRPERRYYPQK
ncbi:response regulator [Metabacillus sp. GX 13764]|uniref:response regulator n=1 Tax=Metabacillus kandeliae TaxID=2900151 RepID=UPI001E501DFF|nr:response regulator [Metabacillus kandeliae]MCD7034284.1 response regulator [Metabacillus kandeliae]